MTQPAIRVENLGKEYQIGVRENGYRTFREAISDTVTSPLRRFKRLSGRAHHRERFWALKDVSFDVQPGEAVGIIGRNGAGKSTLLKILSRITEPTTGRAQIHGRVGSLLEVGTGFHRELTGRENVFLNGAVLGMSRAEIKRKFDEIVDFAEVEQFLDTPVKRYSTGMRVRLAFAVAAHLDPEILIVDEVLSVGDAEFQKKCLQKMDDVASCGRTVLFVTHNMAAVHSLCTRAVILERGSLTATGSPSEIISAYLDDPSSSTSDVDLSAHQRPPTSHSPLIRRLRITDIKGHAIRSVCLGSDFCFELTLATEQPIFAARLNIVVQGSRGERLFSLQTRFQYPESLTLSGTTVICCQLRNCRLVPGRYRLCLLLKSEWNLLDEIDSGLHFDVTPTDVYGTGILPKPKHGLFLPDASWHVISRASSSSGT